MRCWYRRDYTAERTKKLLEDVYAVDALKFKSKSIHRVHYVRQLVELIVGSDIQWASENKLPRR